MSDRSWVGYRICRFLVGFAIPYVMEQMQDFSQDSSDWFFSQYFFLEDFGLTLWMILVFLGGASKGFLVCFEDMFRKISMGFLTFF